MIFRDSSPSYEKEDDDNFEMAIGMIFNEDFWWPRRGPQFSRIHISRDRAVGHSKIIRDCLDPYPTYSVNYFRRRFRMRTNLFLTIAIAMGKHDD